MAPYIISTKTALAVLALLATGSVASPVPQDSAATTISLSKLMVGTTVLTDGKADLVWLKAHEGHIVNKFAASLTVLENNLGHPVVGFSSIVDRKANKGHSKRQSEGLTEEQGGSYWQGAVTIGTPPVSFNM
jgi:hypothetical protein